MFEVIVMIILFTFVILGWKHIVDPNYLLVYIVTACLVHTSKQYKRSIPLALKISKESKVVIQEAVAIIEISYNASLEASSDTVISKQQQEKMRKEIIEVKSNDTSLTGKKENLDKLINDVENLAVEMKRKVEEAVREENLEKNRNVQCESVTESSSGTVCRKINTWWWRNETRCNVETIHITTEKCREKIDKPFVDLKKLRLKIISDRRNVFQSKRLEYRKMKLDYQKQKLSVVFDLQRVVEKLNHLSIEDNSLTQAITSRVSSTSSSIG